MYSRSERNTHDRARGTIRERARKHFFGEKKDMDHEFTHNRNEIKKLMNDGYRFDSVTRDNNRYEVHFVNAKTVDRRECVFNYESNYAKLEAIWQQESEH